MPLEIENEDKKKVLEKTLASITKNFGDGSIVRLGDSPKDFPNLPTGILPLDLAIGIGGLPKGRIVEIYGPEAAGKTLITLQAIAETQKNGGVCAFIDAEHALNVKFAKNVGVDVDALLLSQPDFGEQALEIAEQLVRSGCIDLLVIDSVAALVPKAEIEGEMGDQTIGLQARLMSQAMRKLTAAVAKTNTCIVFINQLREKVGVMYGSNETTCSKKNRYEQEYQNAQEEFERKYGIFGEKLRSEEDIEHEKNTGCRIIYGLTKVPEYQEIWDRYSQEQRDIEAYRHECKDQAFDLMKEHFYDLWD